MVYIALIETYCNQRSHEMGGCCMSESEMIGIYSSIEKAEENIQTFIKSIDVNKKDYGNIQIREISENVTSVNWYKQGTFVKTIFII
jgi:hypothetical protein